MKVSLVVLKRVNGKKVFMIQLGHKRLQKYRRVEPKSFGLEHWNYQQPNRKKEKERKDEAIAAGKEFKPKPRKNELKVVMPAHDGFKVFQTREEEVNDIVKLYTDAIVDVQERGLELTFDNVFNSVDGVYRAKEEELTDKELERIRLTYVFNYYDWTIDELKKQERFGTVSNYRTGMNSLKTFLSAYDDNKSADQYTFTDLTPELLRAYRAAIKKRGVSISTESIYMRNIRALCNRAIEDKVVDFADYPFRNRDIMQGLGKRVYNRRGLRLKDINKIRAYRDKLEKGSSLWVAASIFIFGYRSRGMNYTDIARLRRTDIDFEAGLFTFNRWKTRAKITDNKTIRFSEDREALDIVEYFLSLKDKSNADSPFYDQYVFPILDESCEKEVTKTNRINKRRTAFNKDLKLIADKVGIKSELSSYVYRHSFATVLKIDKGLSVEMVAEAMQEADIVSALHYAKGIDDKVIEGNLKDM